MGRVPSSALCPGSYNIQQTEFTPTAQCIICVENETILSMFVFVLTNSVLIRMKLWSLLGLA